MKLLCLRAEDENGVEWDRKGQDEIEDIRCREPVNEADPGASSRADCCHCTPQ